jgi:hypothetical protein
MELHSVAADAGHGLLDFVVKELGQTMKGVVNAASPAAQEHFSSGFLEMQMGSALWTMDVCFLHTLFSGLCP